MKILFARQLILVLLGAQASLLCAQNSFLDGTLPIKQPKLYHPNDQINDATFTRLTPVHPDSIYQLDNNTMQDSLIDNDGNMYVTTWDLGGKTSDMFLAEQTVCAQKIYEHMILDRAPDIHQIKEEDIKPSLFKEHASCIRANGYALKSKNGFSPDKFKLSIFRSHLKSSDYMPVGRVFYLTKKSAKYIDALRRLNHCSEQARKTDKEKAVEEYSDVYTYVSIKPYVESIESCMKEAGYTIERSDQ